MTEIALIFAIISAASSICAVAAFLINRGKDKSSDGEKQANLQRDVQYIRQNLDEVRLELRDLNRKQNDMNRELALLDAAAKSAHKRLDEHIQNHKGE